MTFTPSRLKRSYGRGIAKKNCKELRCTAAWAVSMWKNNAALQKEGGTEMAG
jgi:hypothetical protein